MRMTSLVRGAAVTAAAALALTACGVSKTDEPASGSSGSATAEKLSGLRIMVPNSPGSGYDQTARAVSADLQSAGLSGSVEVFNQAGAGGTVGLARLINEKGKGDLLMQMGLGVVGASYSNKSEAKLTDTTPIAKLIEESEAIVVAKDSPYKTLDDLINAWKANPGAVPVGGASNVGGPDHLTPMLLAKTVGLEAKKVNYVAYDGGGELMTAVLGKKLGFAATGVSEVIKQAESGDVRVLAVTSDKPVEGLDAKPLKDQGVDMVFTNWRGLVAAPGITDADKQKLVAAVTALHGTEEWKKTLADKGWTDAFIEGDEFKTFLTSESDRVAGVLKELGLV
ncbi:MULTISPECIES: Bug family tripartite tricarboxylate transporter substrate binding protein [unclassified Knoellia]|uniref:Bug family tripartite tricarboxylate transporter substrate binding protein n=1 Tax=Knoellia altitudinis TaxID=3404795 RepID=UPI00361BC0E4